MLFINDEQSEIGNRGKDGRARTDDHARFSALDSVPLLGALAVGERRMKNSDFVAEDLMQIGCDCGCEADFGDEENCRASSFED